MNKKINRPQYAFTLIELLIVAAIIALLVAFAIPIVSRSIERGRRLYCLNNTRQIAIAANLLLEEDRIYLPSLQNPLWFGHASSNLLRYLSGNLQVFDCPSNKNPLRNVNTEIPIDVTPRLYTEYEINGYLCSTPHQRRPLEGITDPSKAAYAYDFPLWELNRNHIDGLNVAFLDGHAEWLPREKFYDGSGRIFYLWGHTFFP